MLHKHMFFFIVECFVIQVRLNDNSISLVTAAYNELCTTQTGIREGKIQYQKSSVLCWLLSKVKHAKKLSYLAFIIIH